MSLFNKVSSDYLAEAGMGRLTRTTDPYLRETRRSKQRPGLVRSYAHPYGARTPQAFYRLASSSTRDQEDLIQNLIKAGKLLPEPKYKAKSREEIQDIINREARGPEPLPDEDEEDNGGKQESRVSLFGQVFCEGDFSPTVVRQDDVDPEDPSLGYISTIKDYGGRFETAHVHPEKGTTVLGNYDDEARAIKQHNTVLKNERYHRDRIKKLLAAQKEKWAKQQATK